MSEKQLYAHPKGKFNISLNQYDFIVLVLLFGLLAVLVWGAQQMTHPYHLGDPIDISLNPSMLPKYSLFTVIRMAIALLCSLVFTFTVGTLAAKNKQAERFIIPFIDVMQSVPVLGFLSITILAFIYLFPGSQIGPECAAIFAIFTSQVWNMALSFYQSLRTVPKDLNEAARMYHLSAWQKFWKIEVPFATPGLLWNTMMSLSAGWFFVVASEAISVANQNITLPGLGSYIMQAQAQANYWAIAYAIIAMLAVILLYDQIIFRPLLSWSEKFKLEANLDEEGQGHWFITFLQRSHLTRLLKSTLEKLQDVFLHRPKLKTKQRKPSNVQAAISQSAPYLWSFILYSTLLAALGALVYFIHQEITFGEVFEVFYLGFITTIKVTILIIISSIVWVPVGVWVGLHPKLSKKVQPVAQILAAFPANLLYPVLFMLITTYHLNVEIWSSPLMILGTQWYILFNVIAGTQALPHELKLAVENYQVKGWLWWRKFILPGIFPFYVTGAMTAAGGCWNASIVADVVIWGDETLRATGLGGYITEYTSIGDFPRIALGIAVMCIYVMIINRLLWRKLFDLAEERYSIG